MKYPLSLRETKTVSLFFKDIVELHFQKGAKILDPTCGKRILWDDINLKTYKIYFSDIKDFKYTDVKFSCIDYKKIPDRFYQYFDGIVFDPPYLFGIDSKTDKRKDDYGGYSQSIENLFAMIDESSRYLIRYLKIGGKLILKCSDQYYVKDHTFYDLSTNWINAYTDWSMQGVDFKIIDKHIFKNHHISGTAWQVKDRGSSIQNYTYFFVFQKEETNND